MLKLLGSLLVLACSAGLGVAGSMDLKRHCMELRLLKQAVYMLRGEIKHAKAPLPEAFGALAGRMASPFSEFFANLAQGLVSGEGRSLKELWEKEIRESLKQSTLRRDEKQRFQQLGEGLGYLDLEMQMSTIELYLEQLEGDIARAQEELQTKQKLYQSLGIAGGIFLVILLV
ncbi:MAG: stage III sporulation protein AB [Lachnospiraceae bacterium]|nr:stage III sporulation protein AB [Lachnospiraceae bacterium]